MKLVVGQRVVIDYMIAKELGNTGLSYDTPLAVEAVGSDWVILRNTNTWAPYAYTVTTQAGWDRLESGCEPYEENL